jgi:ketosteroid isomerase-like protein
MPEASNLETVRAVYAAFDRGDLPGVLDLWSDEATLEWYGPAENPFAGIWRGRAGAQEWLTLVATKIDFHASERREFYAQGDTVVVVGYEKGTMRPTGRVYEQQWVQLFTLRDGAVVRFRQFADTAAVAAAVAEA